MRHIMSRCGDEINPQMEMEQRLRGKHQTMSLKDNNSMATSLGGMLEKLTPFSTECYIYRVPEKRQQVKREAYTPRVVSIGPLHHGEKHLAAMEEHKLRYLQNFLSKSDKTLEECVEIISREEKRARDCYMESIHMSTEEFVKMILVDGCFIIELLLGFWKRHYSTPDDRIYNKPWLFVDVRRDMTLLENQLPFFLLLTLYSLLPLPGHQNDYYSFLLLSVEFFKDYLQMPEAKSSEEIMIEIETKIPSTDEQVKHFVDLLILWLQPSSPRPSTDQSDFKVVIPTATQHQEAGVRFRLRPKDKPLLDINYSNGVLEIPSLILQDKCESLFRNLIAFEQCHSHVHTPITDYIYLMGQLIKTTRDVNLLVSKGIISNHLDDNFVVKNLFYSLLLETTTWNDTFYFARICAELNIYRASPWNRWKGTCNNWKATLRHEYFSSPWRGASTIAAVILLLLTFMQTIFSWMAVK